jgi:hypothetical protein
MRVYVIYVGLVEGNLMEMRERKKKKNILGVFFTA